MTHLPPAWPIYAALKEATFCGGMSYGCNLNSSFTEPVGFQAKWANDIPAAAQTPEGIVEPPRDIARKT